MRPENGDETIIRKVARRRRGNKKESCLWEQTASDRLSKRGVWYLKKHPQQEHPEACASSGNPILGRYTLATLL